MKRLTAALLLVLLLAAPLASALAAEEGEHAAEGATTELIFKWLNFITVFGALGYLLRQPLQAFFAEQRAAIRSGIEEARKAREESRRRLAEVEGRLARLEQEVAALRAEAAENAAAEKQRIQEAARREAERVLATARAEMESVTRAARLELRAYAARLAVSAAEQEIRQRLTPQTQAALFQAFAARLAPGKERRA
jgi:F-type H+-transporting ATPase subunit b